VLLKIMGKVFLCLVLEMGVLSGARIRPEEIEQLMKMSEPCVIQTMRRDGNDLEENAEQERVGAALPRA
jgi:hypothetical protein